MTTQIDKIRDYIQGKNPDFDLNNSTDIIENRLIDSLQFVEFMLFIEEVSGCKFDMENLDIEHFRSLDAIERNLANLADAAKETA